ncbi:MAG: undecaprenyl/decaprenyl-phosphate alpha-N-acetylglucosaminyl 1-phosphate transferase [Spirochaetia bacterium]|nr:undecaprenyl/decaprenyl-phosphate alpha-N-acetylglucosaminyl 1-phosphate transferase [Spirochaetia bacterium]
MLHIAAGTIIFFIAFFSNMIFTPILIRLSHKYSWYDFTDARKIHPAKMPRIGGVGIFAGFALAAFVFVVSCHCFHVKQLNDLSKYAHLLLVTGFFIITTMGLLDDFLNLKAKLKFFIQVLAALCISLGGFKFDIFAIPGTEIGIMLHPVAAHALTILWIISFCNAINLLDGLDGLAGGVSFIGAVFYIIIFTITGNFTAIAVSICILGAIAAFLFFNFPPAKIYMGDSGSLFLGFSMAVIPLINNVPPVSSNVFLPSLLIFIIPIIDMIAAIIRRKRRGLSIFSPDREHLHHKLQDFGFSTRKILAIIYSFTLISGISAVIYAKLTLPFNMIWFFAMWIIYIILFSILHYKNKARKQQSN